MRMMSTPCCAAHRSLTNCRLRLHAVLDTPRDRSRDLLEGPPAVAVTEAAIFPRTCTAARPTPPAAACTSTRCPACTRAASPNADSTVENTVGAVDACTDARAGGRGTRVVGEASTQLPKLPVASPNSAVPAWLPQVEIPAQSLPGSPGSPGYMPYDSDKTMAGALGCSAIGKQFWSGGRGVCRVGVLKLLAAVGFMGVGSGSGGWGQRKRCRGSGDRLGGFGFGSWGPGIWI